MNVQLQPVISNITGKTGMEIIEVVLKGERSSRKLAQLRDGRIRAEVECGGGWKTSAQVAQRRWQEEHIFELCQCNPQLTQALELYRFYHARTSECDRETEASWRGSKTAATAGLRLGTAGAVRATRPASTPGHIRIG